MSYEDLEKARAERAVKEAAKEAKQVDTAGRRMHGRKRKSIEKTGIPEAEPAIPWIGEAQAEEDEIAPEPFRAPVARVW